MTRHLNSDELIDRLYGLASSAVDAHLNACSSCQARLSELEVQRAESAGLAEVPVHALAAQRRAILARVADGPRTRLKWAPALAAGLLAATALLTLSWRPASEPAAKSVPEAAEIADDALLSEIYALELGGEPLAAVPIRALFEQASDQIEEGN